MILHPAVLTKNKDLIAREQMRWYPAIGAHTHILSAVWPRTKAVRPSKLDTRAIPLRDLCEKHEDKLPMTYINGSAEPQLIAEHKLTRETLSYELHLEDFEPILVSASALIGTYSGMIPVRKLTSEEMIVPCLSYEGFKSVASRKKLKVVRKNNASLTIKMAVWEQPHRVAHTSAYLVTGPGIVLG